MLERLELIDKRYQEINDLLVSPEVLGDISKSRELSKEQAGLEETVNTYHQYQSIEADLEEAKAMVSDPELADFAREEIDRLTKEKEEILKKLEILLLPKDENDGKNIIVEIRGASGGDEGNIFAGDLFRMYSKYADKQGWKTQILNASEGEAGGFSQIEFSIKGDNVYSKLKYESGTHRVQRVPVTESNGRLQTSTATVIVMPEAEEFDYQLNMDEIRIDITRASGKGGQGVNTTDSAVRITHIPTGIIVYSQTERSQIQNKETGLKILQTRLYNLKLKEKLEKEGAERRNKIGSGDRSEKIRTYNYPQNRVTDHRIGFTTKHLDYVMEGDLDEIIDALISEDQRRILEGANDN